MLSSTRSHARAGLYTEIRTAPLLLDCPNCHKDVPSPDLGNFVRFYNGDEGYETCPHCNEPILWKMSVRENIALVPHKEKLLRAGLYAAQKEQILAKFDEEAGAEPPYGAFDELSDWMERLRDLSKEERYVKVRHVLLELGPDHLVTPWLLSQVLRATMTDEQEAMVDAEIEKLSE